MHKKLEHSPKRDQNILKQVLREYRHLFYKEGSLAIGCTSQVKHAIETGDARPVKINPYRIPHAMKLVKDCVRLLEVRSQ